MSISFVTIPLIVVAVIIVLAVLASGYVKASPNKAYIISGLRKEPKVLIGRAGIKIPFLEKKDELMLKQISIDIKTNGYIPTKDFIGVDIDAVAKVRVITVKDVTVDKNGNLLPGADPNKYITHAMAQAAMKNFLNMRLAIKKAELKKASDIKQAEADAAYKIQEQEQRKSIEVSSANADIAKQEREIELKRREAEVTEQTLDAQVKKKAEAEKFARQQAAEAELIERQRKADAEMYEKQKTADAKKIEADAMMYAKAQEAEAIKKVGEAEAEAIRAKGIAEAEATEKKADAMAKYGKAAMTEMIVKILPEMAREIAQPLAAIDKITIIDGGNGEPGVNSMGGYVPQVLAKTIESIKETTGFDLTEVMKADTYDAKVNKNIDVTGLNTVKSSEHHDPFWDTHSVEDLEGKLNHSDCNKSCESITD